MGEFFGMRFKVSRFEFNLNGFPSVTTLQSVVFAATRLWSRRTCRAAFVMCFRRKRRYKRQRSRINEEDQRRRLEAGACYQPTALLHSSSRVP